jgi:hypothetical protein
MKTTAQPIALKGNRRILPGSRPHLRRITHSVTVVVGSLALLGGCQPPEPATPALITISGHGTFYEAQPSFTFAFPDRTGDTITHHTGATIRISVPYPSSLGLTILRGTSSTPLTKVDGPMLSDRYTYTASIDNPGGNPATWTISIRQPFDVPFYRSSSGAGIFYLDITDSNPGFTTPAPLRIQFLSPDVGDPLNIWPHIYSLTSQDSTGATLTPWDAPVIHTTEPLRCPPGNTEQTFNVCFKFEHPAGSWTEWHRLSVNACSSDEAASRFSNWWTDLSRDTCPP